MKKEKWLELLKDSKAFCYIKPNQRIHESGFRCFEVGYLTVGNDLKIKDKLVLGEYTDHIQQMEYLDKVKVIVNMDLLKDGYIRFHARYPLWWESMNFVVSSATLERIDFKL